MDLIDNMPSDTPPRDATEDMVARNPAADGTQLYRSMFDNAVFGLFQTTPDGHYLSANRALARIFGYDTPAEMRAGITNIGSQLYVDRNRRGEFIRLMREHGAVSGFESQIYRRDGSIIWISETCREVHTPDGALLYYEGSVEDVTRRKQAEQDLVAAKDEAEAASRTKTYFLAHMSHELRTPLNAVIGFAEVLRGELMGPLGNDRYRDYADSIHQSGQHLLDIINDILDLAKIGAGRRTIAEADIDIGALLSECAGVAADSARQRRIEMKLSVPRDAMVVRGDPDRIRAMLSNLLSNAIKFTPPSQRVTLSAERAADGACLLKIADTGIGMRANEIEKALQPFQQVSDVFTRRYAGTGLGLTLSKAFAELHGGTLDIDSTPGQGTTVTVHLPRWRVFDGVQALQTSVA